MLDFVSRRLQEMPYGLRVLTRVLLAFATFTPIITILLLLAQGSHSHFTINGKQVSYDEFVQRGGFAVLFLIPIYCGILAFGFLRASRWSRPLCCLTYIGIRIVGFVHRQTPIAFYSNLTPLLVMALLVWYLFFRQTVRDYYAKTRERHI